MGVGVCIAFTPNKQRHFLLCAHTYTHKHVNISVHIKCKSVSVSKQ